MGRRNFSPKMGGRTHQEPATGVWLRAAAFGTRWPRKNAENMKEERSRPRSLCALCVPSRPARSGGEQHGDLGLRSPGSLHPRQSSDVLSDRKPDPGPRTHFLSKTDRHFGSHPLLTSDHPRGRPFTTVAQSVRMFSLHKQGRSSVFRADKGKCDLPDARLTGPETWADAAARGERSVPGLDPSAAYRRSGTNATAAAR